MVLSRAGLAALSLLAACPQLHGSAVVAATIRVPENQPTIQAGIDAAAGGDTVLVAAGTYYEHDIQLKSGITLLGGGPAAAGVVIDAQRQGRVMRGRKSTDAPMFVTIRGFTFRAGLAGRGAGILCDETYGRGFDVVLSDCAFQDNEATQGGGGMYISGSRADLRDCTFVGNVASQYGGGLACETSYGVGELVLTACRFSENTAGNKGGGLHSTFYALAARSCEFRGNHAARGGGVFSLAYFPFELVLAGCTFAANSATQGGALFSSDDDLFVTSCLFLENVAESGGAVFVTYPQWQAAIEASTFAGNVAEQGSGICLSEFGQLDVEHCIFAGGQRGAALDCVVVRTVELNLACCDVYGNAGGDWVGCIADQAGDEGNFSADPRFCLNLDPDQPYTLQANSPCAQANNSECGQVGAFAVGCGTTTAAATSFSAIKALY
jgi:predicted outer membrane repeat protein